MTKASASEKSTSSNEDNVSELPVLSPDGESTAETSESSSDRSVSDDKDRSDTQTAVQDENGTSDGSQVQPKCKEGRTRHQDPCTDSKEVRKEVQGRGRKRSREGNQVH